LKTMAATVMARDKYNNQLKGGDENSNSDGNSDSDSNDNDAVTNNSALMTATRMTRPGCATRWWRWRRCQNGGGERDGNSRGGYDSGSRRSG
jgi:hypothetical protein